MKVAYVAGILALLVMVIAVVIVSVVQTKPIRIDIAGAGSCPPGVGECRMVAALEVVSTPPTPPVPPEFAATDFSLDHAFGLGSDHVVLPGCGNGSDVGYYAYTHPQAHGRLDSKEGFVIGGLPQQHALALQSTPPYIEFEGVKHMVMVSSNLLECDRFEGQVVKVKP